MREVLISCIRMLMELYDVASEYNILDPYENGRGTALSDVLYRGQLDIISGNWDGEHRIFIKKENSF